VKNLGENKEDRLGFFEEFNQFKADLESLRKTVESMKENPKAKQEKEAKKNPFVVEVLKDPLIDLKTFKVFPAMQVLEEVPAYEAPLYPIPRLIALIKSLAERFAIDITKTTVQEFIELIQERIPYEKPAYGAGQGEAVETAILPSGIEVDLDSMTDEQVQEYVDSIFPKRWKKSEVK